MRHACASVLFALVGLALSILAAGAATPQKGSLMVGGEERTYTLFRPAAKGGPKPIVMMLHGGGGDGARMVKQTGLARYVDSNDFIAVFPDAGGTQWNDGRETTRSNRDDVAFLLALIRKLVAEAGADPRRVFVAGVSNGGMLAQRLACEAAGSVTAAGVVIANLPSALAASCHPARPVPMVFFISTDDPIMPFAGGDVKAGMLRGAGGKVISGLKTVNFWARVNGCGADTSTPLPDRTDDGTMVVLHSFACPAASTQFYEIRGGGHTWPGGAVSDRPFVRRLVGNTSQDIHATELMIQFFHRYGL
ncbi:alpha/beta hydrolase family esterase [Ancylobacter pratisalsi]|uniref:Alpha/beta hydrolase fold domain-containing protein n=1 Tax=Ancylobacter pratisalsi TaxID=1745854 RepID=A0A6P1YNZ4_9HYPH|nr:PHB depolymerase family esterase [Ancylobacter pratisalsi]QIB35187.1 alpha/beta hydrolase fold domain-containing protein [Ancylobacter pratisalsi]